MVQTFACISVDTHKRRLWVETLAAMVCVLDSGVIRVFADNLEHSVTAPLADLISNLNFRGCSASGDAPYSAASLWRSASTTLFENLRTLRVDVSVMHTIHIN